MLFLVLAKGAYPSFFPTHGVFQLTIELHELAALEMFLEFHKLSSRKSDAAVPAKGRLPSLAAGIQDNQKHACYLDAVGERLMLRSFLYFIYKLFTSLRPAVPAAV